MWVRNNLCGGRGVVERDEVRLVWVMQKKIYMIFHLPVRPLDVAILHILHAYMPSVDINGRPVILPLSACAGDQPAGPGHFLRALPGPEATQPGDDSSSARGRPQPTGES